MGQEVLIGCKLPNGFWMEIVEPAMSLNAEGKPVQGMYPKPPGKRVYIKGANTLRAGKEAPSQVVYPFATTRVDKEFWEAWHKRNKDMEFVKKELVFMAENKGNAEAMASERAAEKTGMEPLPVQDDRALMEKMQLGQAQSFELAADKDALAKAKAA